MTDTYATSNPTCPYCGFEDPDHWEWDLDGDGDTTDVECGRCDREFTVRISLSPTFSTWRPECTCEGNGWCDACRNADEGEPGDDGDECTMETA